MTDMTKEDAARVIAEKTNAAMALVREAEEIAKEHKLDFHFDVAYGMGGWYNGDEDWDDSDCYDNEDRGWNPSSQSC